VIDYCLMLDTLGTSSELGWSPDSNPEEKFITSRASQTPLHATSAADLHNPDRGYPTNRGFDADCQKSLLVEY